MCSPTHWDRHEAVRDAKVTSHVRLNEYIAIEEASLGDLSSFLIRTHGLVVLKRLIE